eukprot:555863-Amphidinium_carterae.1
MCWCDILCAQVRRTIQLFLPGLTFCVCFEDWSVGAKFNQKMPCRPVSAKTLTVPATAIRTPSARSELWDYSM